jgi:hypothetical protein
MSILAQNPPIIWTLRRPLSDSRRESEPATVKQGCVVESFTIPDRPLCGLMGKKKRSALCLNVVSPQPLIRLGCSNIRAVALRNHSHPLSLKAASSDVNLE